MDETQPKPDQQSWIQKIIPSWQALRGSGIGALITGIATYLGVETNIIGERTYPPVTASNEAVAMAEWGRMTPEVFCEQQTRLNKSLTLFFQGLAEKNGKTNPDYSITSGDCLQILNNKKAEPKL